MTSLATTQTEWARLIAFTLRDAGVRHVIASPGSRSTPFLAACLASDLRVHDVLDERSAAFVALGHARATGEPAAVLCTSGTAPAHYFPAVIEASLAEVPMVLLTADRPTELSLCGAAQAIDQLRLFGEHVRLFADAGSPDASEGALVGLRRLVGQAVARSRGPSPGPVHLNLRARKPLEPRQPVSEPEHALRRLADEVLARPLASVRARVEPDEREVASLAARLSKSQRPLFVAGPGHHVSDPRAIHALVRRTGGVLAAELTSGLRFAGGAPRLDSLDAWLSAGLWQTPGDGPTEPPDLVIELGRIPTSSAYERWVSRTRPRRVVLGVGAYSDPHGSAEQILLGELEPLASDLAARVPERLGGSAFTERLEELGREGDRLAAALAEPWGEAAIAREVVARAPDAARLVVGNSLPIRMLDRYATREARTTPLTVIHQRGANGIDGLVAQSFGVQLDDGRPTVALLGDLTLLHDVGSLAVARRAVAPLVLVVVDNCGGRIFDTLPVARDAAWMMPHMIAEERVDHAALAAAFGVAHARVDTLASLRSALVAGLARPGLSLIVAVVPPRGAVALEAERVARHEAALAARRRLP